MVLSLQRMQTVKLFLKAGQLIVELAKRYYEQNDASILPRSIATKAAFKMR